jgi:hypothetical protein
MIEDVGPQYKGKQFSNSAAAAWWWVDNWERSGDKSGDQQKHINFLNQYKFGSGGDKVKGAGGVGSGGDKVKGAGGVGSGGDEDVKNEEHVKSIMTQMKRKKAKNSTMAASLVPGVTSPTSSSLATSPSIKFQPSYYGNKTYILPINTTVIAAVPSKNSSGGIYAEPSQSYTSLNTNNVYHMILQQ